MSALEVQEVAEIACGNESVSSERMKKEFKRMNKNHDGVVTLDEFVSLVKDAPVLLPAFEMRNTLRTITIGVKRWSELANERNKKYPELHIMDILANMKVKPMCHMLKKVNFDHNGKDQRSVIAMEYYRKRNRRESKSSAKKISNSKLLSDPSQRKNSVGYHFQKKKTAFAGRLLA
jgi:hypothetical protein